MVNDASSWSRMVDHDIYIYNTGLWFEPLSNTWVSWDDDSQQNGNINFMFQTANQKNTYKTNVEKLPDSR